MTTLQHGNMRLLAGVLRTLIVFFFRTTLDSIIGLRLFAFLFPRTEGSLFRHESLPFVRRTLDQDRHAGRTSCHIFFILMILCRLGQIRTSIHSFFGIGRITVRRFQRLLMKLANVGGPSLDPLKRMKGGRFINGRQFAQTKFNYSRRILINVAIIGERARRLTITKGRHYVVNPNPLPFPGRQRSRDDLLNYRNLMTR